MTRPRSTAPAVPSQMQLVLPLLEVVREAGGSARARDVGEAIAERLGLSQAQRDAVVVTGDGQRVNVWQRHVRYARQKARAMGYLDAPERGTWGLTEIGQEGLRQRRTQITVTLRPATEDRPLAAQIAVDVGLPTQHTLVQGDARDLSWIDDNAIPLVVTSVPYFDIKAYEAADGQLGRSDDYAAFLDEMNRVLAELYRVLIPGGRFACNVGDVLRARKLHGTHHVLPLHADLLVRGRATGFLPLNGILWHKIGNVAHEQGGAGLLGKPGQPNAIVPQEVEHILLMRKPGAYRHPTEAQRRDGHITKAEHAAWFKPIWSDIPGARATKNHPAPFPVEIPRRLARMFSFPGDSVLDPFAGSFTTSVGAAHAGRDSIGVEIGQGYLEHGIRRLSDLGAVA